MQLTMFYYPTRDVKASVRFYRDILGWEEAWREGETTVAFRLPGTDVQLMIDHEENPATGRPGIFLRVDSVDAFYRENRHRLDFVGEPIDIPPGRYVVFNDPAGNAVHVYDHTRDA